MSMQYGISIQATIPVRETPSDKSQMVNQLLFGDLYLIKETQGSWSLIETQHDHYEGWVDSKQLHVISEKDFNQLTESKIYFVNSLCGKVTDEKNNTIPVTFGAKIYAPDKHTFFIGHQRFSFSGELTEPITGTNGRQIVATAQKFLGAAYLWGGRSPFGIDCSGFTQIVFALNNIPLLRDASQQVDLGEQVNFIEETQAGDLAFFGNEEGQITHVGIMMNHHQIIHASGNVHIDPIDHHGIYNEVTKSYTHTLRVIKRVVS